MNFTEFKEQLDASIEMEVDVRGVRVMPFLTLSAMDIIVEEMLKKHTLNEREHILISAILQNCTTLLDDYDPDDEDAVDISYTELICSGFWDELMEKCPYLKQCIDLIRAEIERKESLQYVLNETLKMMADAVQGLDLDLDKLKDVAD